MSEILSPPMSAYLLAVLILVMTGGALFFRARTARRMAVLAAEKDAYGGLVESASDIINRTSACRAPCVTFSASRSRASDRILLASGGSNAWTHVR
jgi:hypothetical protein